MIKGSQTASWGRRAGAYDELIRRWPLFGLLAGRLLADSGVGPLLDLGAGSGLLTELALGRTPGRKVTLLEPVTEMQAFAFERLSPLRPSILACTAEELAAPQASFEAVLSSAAFHLVDEAIALPRIAQCLGENGLFSCNLWWHSFDETVQELPDDLAGGPLRQALSELGFDSVQLPGASPRRLRSRQDFSELGTNCGLRLEHINVDRDEVSRRFFVEFAAMSPSFLTPLDRDQRGQVFQRALALADDSLNIPSVRLVMRKESRRA